MFYHGFLSFLSWLIILHIMALVLLSQYLHFKLMSYTLRSNYRPSTELFLTTASWSCLFLTLDVFWPSPNNHVAYSVCDWTLSSTLCWSTIFSSVKVHHQLSCLLGSLILFICKHPLLMSLCRHMFCFTWLYYIKMRKYIDFLTVYSFGSYYHELKNFLN